MKYETLKTYNFFFQNIRQGRSGRNRMVVEFTTTHASGAYHH